MAGRFIDGIRHLLVEHWVALIRVLRVPIRGGILQASRRYQNRTAVPLPVTRTCHRKERFGEAAIVRSSAATFHRLSSGLRRFRIRLD